MPSLRLARVAPASSRDCSSVGPLHDDAELVAGQAAHEVARPRGGGRHQGVRDALEGAVAGVVAGLVVDRLQLVDVAEQHGQGHVAIGGADHRALQPLLEGAPVGKTGQRVLVGEPRHAREQLGPADRHRQLTGDGLEEADVVAAEARLAGRRGRVDLSPGLALDEDRHADLGLLAEPRQSLGWRPRRSRASRRS